MAKRLSDREKKEIVAGYVELGSYRAVAKKHGVAVNTVKSIVGREAGIAQKCTRKKEENTSEILANMQGKTKSVIRLMDFLLEERLNPEVNREELSSIPLAQLATAFGIVVDKMLKVQELQAAQRTVQDNGLADAIRNSAREVFDDAVQPVQPEADEGADMVGASRNSRPV